MCLILFSYNMHPNYQLVIAANRDEFYDRPTKGLFFWDNYHSILAGQDLKGRGTWLGVTRKGRFAAITNYREPVQEKENAPSRGLLVSGFLAGRNPPRQYLDQMEAISNRYNGFNLIAGDRSTLLYFSNRKRGIQELDSGIYGLSNHLLDTPWPKVEKGKAELKALLDSSLDIDVEKILAILEDRSYPPDHMLPDTGVGRTWERVLSPLFIQSEKYGTRSSSVILMEKTGKVTFVERSSVHNDSGSMDPTTRKFTFQISN